VLPEETCQHQHGRDSTHLPPAGRLQTWHCLLQSSSMVLHPSSRHSSPTPAAAPTRACHLIEWSSLIIAPRDWSVAPLKAGASDATNVWFVAARRTHSSRGLQNRFCWPSSPYCGASSPCYMPHGAPEVDVILRNRPSVPT
jgi:hypothetical protein